MTLHIQDHNIIIWEGIMNNIEYAAVFQRELDKMLVAEAVTGWMDANASMAKYAGAGKSRFRSLTWTGLPTMTARKAM